MRVSPKVTKQIKLRVTEPYLIQRQIETNLFIYLLDKNMN